MRSVSFVTGAVSMETMPSKKIPEVGFIGRSNVGKSSIINMICNRRYYRSIDNKQAVGCFLGVVECSLRVVWCVL